MRITKEITFAYPSSINATKLGYADSGCWYVSQTLHDIEGSGQAKTILPHNAEGFETPDHPDLIALFHEHEGEPSKAFIRYGNNAALRALGL